MDITSKRTYGLVRLRPSKEMITRTFSLTDLLFVKEEDETEEDYALEEQLDAILDMKVQDTLNVYLNRDGVVKRGILIRFL